MEAAFPDVLWLTRNFLKLELAANLGTIIAVGMIIVLVHFALANASRKRFLYWLLAAALLPYVALSAAKFPLYAAILGLGIKWLLDYADGKRKQLAKVNAIYLTLVRYEADFAELEKARDGGTHVLPKDAPRWSRIMVKLPPLSAAEPIDYEALNFLFTAKLRRHGGPVTFVKIANVADLHDFLLDVVAKYDPAAAAAYEKCWANNPPINILDSNGIAAAEAVVDQALRFKLKMLIDTLDDIAGKSKDEAYSPAASSLRSAIVREWGDNNAVFPAVETAG